MDSNVAKLRDCVSVLDNLANQIPSEAQGLRALSGALLLVVALEERRLDKPKDYPEAIEVDWADKPRYPYQIAKCRKCERPIASGDDQELGAAGWQHGEDSGRWYCPMCCG